MNETTGSSACEMTSLVTIGKFQFTANGDSPLNNITRITVTATAGNLYSSLAEGSLVMVVNSHCDHLFGLLLADHILVKL